MMKSVKDYKEQTVKSVVSTNRYAVADFLMNNRIVSPSDVMLYAIATIGMDCYASPFFRFQTTFSHSNEGYITPLNTVTLTMGQYEEYIPSTRFLAAMAKYGTYDSILDVLHYFSKKSLRLFMQYIFRFDRCDLYRMLRTNRGKFPSRFHRNYINLFLKNRRTQHNDISLCFREAIANRAINILEYNSYNDINLFTSFVYFDQCELIKSIVSGDEEILKIFIGNSLFMQHIAHRVVDRLEKSNRHDLLTILLNAMS